MTKLPSIFRLAKEASLSSDHHTYKVGAVLFVKGKPCSVGYNSNKSHPIIKKFSAKSLHAEVAAVLGSKLKDLNGATICVYRQTKDGKPAMARPCIICQRILSSFGIREYVYTISGSWTKESI